MDIYLCLAATPLACALERTPEAWRLNEECNPMKLDFWNNPLVVSALRVRYRQGGILRLSIIWMLVLTGLGVVVQYFRDEIEPPYQLGLAWHRFYFFALFGLQWVVSCATAAFSVASSMQAEVSNRTLDFQRIVALSPRQLLLGKMLGEPIQAYLLALTSLPLAVWCWAIGVPGLTLTVLLLLYFNLFTAIFMFSAGALVGRLELKDGKVQGGGGIGLVFGVTGVTVFSAWMGGASLLTIPAAAGGFSLFAPVPAFAGLVMGDAFEFPVILFGLTAPCLLVTPLCQLAFAAVFFRIMERRLRDPIVPTLSKPMAYLLLIAADVLTAGVLWNPLPGALPLVERIVVFCVVHLIVTLSVLSLATPGYDTISSWVWRYRGRTSWWRDFLLGERSPIDLMAPTCSVFGAIILGILVIAPGFAQDGTATRDYVLPMVLTAWAMVSLLSYIGGWLMQFLTFSAKTEAAAGAIALLIAADGLWHGLGAYYELDVFRQMSPSGHAAVWFQGAPPLNPLPLLIVYALIVPLLVFVWIRILKRMTLAVDHQLRLMGVPAKLPHAKKSQQVS